MQVRRPAAVKSNHGTRGQVPSTDEKNVSYCNPCCGLPRCCGSRGFARRGHDNRRERHGGLPDRHHRRQQRRHHRNPPHRPRTLRQRLRRHIRPPQREHARTRQRPHGGLHRRHTGQQPSDRAGRPRLPRPAGLRQRCRGLRAEQHRLQDRAAHVRRQPVQRQAEPRRRLVQHLAALGAVRLQALRPAGAQTLRLCHADRRRLPLGRRTAPREQRPEAVPRRSRPLRSDAGRGMAGQALLEQRRQDLARSFELAVREPAERPQRLPPGTAAPAFLRTLLPGRQRQGGG